MFPDSSYAVHVQASCHAYSLDRGYPNSELCSPDGVNKFDDCNPTCSDSLFKLVHTFAQLAGNAGSSPAVRQALRSRFAFFSTRFFFPDFDSALIFRSLRCIQRYFQSSVLEIRFCSVRVHTFR
jgi:hypothetical protein